MAEGLDLGLSGLASGFDWRSLIDQLLEVERAPQRRLLSEQQTITDRKSAYSSIATQLGVLQNRVDEFNDGTLFDTRKTTTTDEDIATALAEAGASQGTFAFHVIQMATSATRQGTSNVGRPLSATTDVSGVTLGGAPFGTPVKAGTFMVNGEQVTVESADTLQGVFDKISAATGGTVTAGYDPNTDTITLTGTGEIVLGSAADSSNFLQVARLSNNGTATVTSSSALGAVRMSGSVSSANLATAISDGGAGAGSFKINGVEITFSASADSISEVLKRINDSSAGVTASCDSVNDRFLLTNKSTGDVGIALEDVTGNFLAATGLTTGTLQRGKDLLYTVNNGGQLSSHSNTITEDSSGIDGLSVTVLAEGDVTVGVASDTEKIKKVITDFIADYNKAQALIDTNIASTTDAKGKVTAGILAGESEPTSIASELRRMVAGSFSFLKGAIQRLESIGITTSGENNNLTLSNTARLDAALSGDLDDVKALFTHESSGLAVKLAAYLERTIGDDGSLSEKQDNLDRQVADIDEQISEQERMVQSNRAQLIASFTAMESAQQRINQQLQFLAQRFGSTSN
jgi:flagellar hook-associated protein 2